MPLLYVISNNDRVQDIIANLAPDGSRYAILPAIIQ